MLEEVLNSVKQTEQQAAQMVAEAQERAAEALRANQQAIDELWSDSKALAKERRSNVLNEAALNADAEADRIAADYARRCEALRQEGMAQVDSLVNDLMESIFNGNC